MIFIICFYSHLNLTSLLPYYHNAGGEGGSEYGRRVTGGYPGKGRWAGLRNKVRVMIFFQTVQILILTCYCFFSAGPTAGPDGAGASALKLALIYERRREAKGGMEGEGEVGE